MSGGIAYVLDYSGDFRRHRCNLEMVELEEMVAPQDIAELKGLLEKHLHYTGSTLAERILAHWEAMLAKFVKVMPVDYKRALKMLAKQQKEENGQRVKASHAPPPDGVEEEMING
jgi:glutamate synthase domain-containing protein 3